MSRREVELKEQLYRDGLPQSSLVSLGRQASEGLGDLSGSIASLLAVWPFLYGLNQACAARSAIGRDGGVYVRDT